MRQTIFTITIVISFLITSCATSPTNTQTSVRTKPRLAESTDKSVQALLSTAISASPSKANSLRLQAAEKAASLRNFDQAENILNLIDERPNSSRPPIYRTDAFSIALLQTKIAIHRGDADLALGWLAKSAITSASLTKSDRIQLAYLRSQAFYLNRSYIASARERIFLDSSLPFSERPLNHEKIFSTLMELSAGTLTKQAQKAITSDLRGWLSLAAMSKQHQNNPRAQLDELRRWQTVWSNHPAALQLPLSLKILTTVVSQQAKSIALFLPMEGNLGSYGRSIRDGVIAASYELQSPAKIHIYDTSKQGVEDLLAAAVNDGAELIIGPLQKDKVSTLVNLKRLPIPVLALNRSSMANTHPNVYQLGLAPEDEMIQLADQVFKEGKKNVLAIYPDTDWGNRNFEVFKQHWQTKGGNIIGSSAYSDQKDYSKLVKSLLNVDKSEQRSQDLRQIVGTRFEFTPRRRQDIDFVFLLGNQKQARGINPTLAFYYAEDIPVYSTSHINELNDSKIESLDLNGIRFCDIPWKLHNTDPLQNDIKSLWAKANANLAPFYALGVDAFRLYPRLQQLKDISATKVYGSTGILTLDKENILRRELLWAQFTKGEIITSPLVLEP
jgi:outer membrane PBP1 activator LpoA protein